MLDRLRAWPAFTVLIAWTLFLWVSRTRNVVSNEELSTWGITWRLGVVVVFVVLALLALRRSTRDPFLPVLVWWTIGYWLIRGGGILLDDHDAAFKVVHTVLMVVSIGGAMWVWQTRTR